MGNLTRPHLMHGDVALAVVAIDDLAAAPAAAVSIADAAESVVTCALVPSVSAWTVADDGTDVSDAVVLVLLLLLLLG